MARCFKCGIFYKDKEKHKKECEVYQKECNETISGFARFMGEAHKKEASK